ncbi:MAG: sulfurtransferase [Legionellaceae bacterium]|nr:sulfurtransferase [Legionellaceae bacterium]
MNTHDSAFLQLVEQAKQHINEMDVKTLKQRAQTKKLFLVDVREESEWQRGHVEGAIYLGKGVIERDIERVIPDKKALIVLYCGGGYRSALAAENLQRMGYTNVYSLKGGYSAM